MRLSAVERKNRLKQSLDEYEVKGLTFHRNYVFGQDMIRRFERNKSLTTKQRQWVDNIIEQPLPYAKNDELFKQLIDASKVVGLPDNKKNTILDLASSAFKWDLSDKQLKFIDSMLEYARQFKITGPYEPDDKTCERLRLILKFKHSRRGEWYENHPGVNRSMQALIQYFLYLDAGDDVSTGVVLRSKLEEWQVNMLLKSFKTRLNAIENPKFKIADTGWVNHMNELQMATILGEPFIEEKNGLTYYPCLVGMTSMNVLDSHIKKVRRK